MSCSSLAAHPCCGQPGSSASGAGSWTLHLLSQVFTLFKTSRTHMFLACSLVAPAPSHVIGPDGVVAVRSQQDLLAGKDGKAVTGARLGRSQGAMCTCWVFAGAWHVGCNLEEPRPRT